jgi:hypothetical protein
MTLDLSHLTAPTREQAFHYAKNRIRLVQTARWVGFPRAGIAVEELERRFHYPSCARMPCIPISGAGMRRHLPHSTPPGSGYSPRAAGSAEQSVG